MKSTGRLIGFLLILMLVATGFSGCNQKVGQELTTTKELTISVYDRGQISSEEGDYNNNRWTRWIKEQTGINVKWIPIPRNDAKQKLSVLVATGEAPDIITEYDQSFIYSLYEQGVLLPLDDYIEEYSTTYKKYLSENPELLPYVTLNDGKMYAFNSVRSSSALANHSMWIRQDWLDNLGLKMPETADEFIETAKAFTFNDPDKNGVNDTLGISFMNWKDISQAMFTASSLWYLEDGKLVYGPTTDRFADSLDFVKKLYDAKVIDQEFITDKDYSQQRQMWVTGKTGILTHTVLPTLSGTLINNVPTAKPVPLPLLETKNGKNGLWQEIIANRYCVITNTAKDPETAVKFLDWVLDEGWFPLTYGEENVHYQSIDGIPQTIDLEKKTKEVDYAVDYVLLSQNDVPTSWLPTMAASDEHSQRLAKLQMNSVASALGAKFRRDLPYEPPVSEFTILRAEFTPLLDQIRMETISGGAQTTAEQGMERIRSEWRRLGGTEVEKAVNNWYAENKNILY